MFRNQWYIHQKRNGVTMYDYQGWQKDFIKEIIRDIEEHISHVISHKDDPEDYFDGADYDFIVGMNEVIDEWTERNKN